MSQVEPASPPQQTVGLTTHTAYRWTCNIPPVSAPLSVLRVMELDCSAPQQQEVHHPLLGAGSSPTLQAVCKYHFAVQYGGARGMAPQRTFLELVGRCISPVPLFTSP